MQEGKQTKTCFCTEVGETELSKITEQGRFFDRMYISTRRLRTYTAAKVDERKCEKKRRKNIDSSCQSKAQNFAMSRNRKSTNKARDVFDIMWALSCTNKQSTCKQDLLHARAHTGDFYTNEWARDLQQALGASDIFLPRGTFHISFHNFSKLTFPCLIAYCQTFKFLDQYI